MSAVVSLIRPCISPHTSGGQCPRSCYHMSGAVAGGGTWRREDAQVRRGQYWGLGVFLYQYFPLVNI